MILLLALKFGDEKHIIVASPTKIGTINKTKYTKYKLQGLNNLLSISLKYIGLLSLTPLRGILPGIAAKTYATRKLVGSMYHSLHYEKNSFFFYNLMLYLIKGGKLWD